MNTQEFLDGFALWQEHQPQTASDWMGVAERTLDADAPYDQGSVHFYRLCSHLQMARHYASLIAEKHSGNQPDSKS